ncbi:nucleotidyltransferase domain-containing protein [Candidatus Woesearchaeota archaeon]|nr:nucleotidyltransferase domain-containing protein [Candidatus Woesearchaeota archaeon]
MKKKLLSVKPTTIDAYTKIQNYFFDYPTKELSLNDMCSAVKISKTNANIYVEKLIKEGFLKRQIIGKLWRISCNQKHYYNHTRKVLYHLGLIFEAKIIEAVYEAIPNARTIVLFGSYRKGDDTEKSDIDIAVEIIGGNELKIIELDVIHQLGYKQNVCVNLHIFSRNNINLNLFANIANGIVLEGFLEVKP